MSKTHSYKLVLLGESAVGKSSITLRFVRNEFTESQEPTIGAAFLARNITCQDYTVRFEIWDTAGQERYHSLAPMYYRGAPAAVVVYDVTDRNSYEKAKKWVQQLKEEQRETTTIALAGNKRDLPNHKVTIQEAQEYAVAEGLIFHETSALSNYGITELFKELADKLPKKSSALVADGGMTKLLDDDNSGGCGC
ncbi:Small GTPase superfamily, ARF type [Carpediemonas membranifera]|uniref:Small GTPase superfamily, ARF type n=1 Tax=Carpediemonas membranifera TaxID=201153 RepID=A0A8J6E4F4_9EUKA|nr:Small GTPase superfamily, ARF type [Carpediemonas membranifera]|eukprot:KAG9394387.1 Small GTPase superfamily, ARF type [Carpediemonas membranifera]